MLCPAHFCEDTKLNAFDGQYGHSNDQVDQHQADQAHAGHSTNRNDGEEGKVV